MGTLGIPLYMDRNIILDLYSTIINGYIESKEELFLNTKDNYIKTQLGNKISNGNDSKKTDPNDKNLVISNSLSNVKDSSLSLENRRGKRVQTRVKKSFTTFSIFNSLIKIMYSKNMIKSDLGYVEDFNSINIGDFLELYTKLSNKSLQAQISTVISIIDSYDPKVLNKLLPYDDPKFNITNFEFICKMLKNLLDILNKNNTNKIILKSKTFFMVLDVNLNYFMDKNSYIYDNVNNNFKVMCKVTRKIRENEHINLLDKTCMSSYYIDLLNLTKCYLDVLRKYDIILPEEFSYLINYPAIEAKAIAMFI
ncbi:hypothetical protein FDN13_08310 [Caloramator sp. E03]|uniref:DUF6414 family protein n=1 Tax=Caloramator sp. E03 TaxID=2576307 RepID=UPI0011104C15|nr:hypothetical protein [Caloramator sp. E03]QCX33702.1 hypothetical protein FDN13_08310 [Caloramator sp. E03]